MRSTIDSENGRRMAQWRATGGAGHGPAGQAGCADDRLEAASYTGRYGIPCGTDDGLAATSYSYRACTDDGLEAASYSYRACTDDGLAAASYSYRACTDDGLRTASTHPVTTACRFDDGLAVGPTIGFQCT